MNKERFDTLRRAIRIAGNHGLEIPTCIDHANLKLVASRMVHEFPFFAGVMFAADPYEIIRVMLCTVRTTNERELREDIVAHWGHVRDDVPIYIQYVKAASGLSSKLVAKLWRFQKGRPVQYSSDSVKESRIYSRRQTLTQANACKE